MRERVKQLLSHELTHQDGKSFKEHSKLLFCVSTIQMFDSHKTDQTKSCSTTTSVVYYVQNIQFPSFSLYFYLNISFLYLFQYSPVFSLSHVFVSFILTL